MVGVFSFKNFWKNLVFIIKEFNMAKTIRLTEADLTRLVKKVIEEQSSKDVSCLIKAGYKKESIGGPMTKREVYSATKNGMKHQINVNGGIRVFNDSSNKTGKWMCENGKIKIMGLKDTPSMPM
jgi:hypothetical protein